MMDGEFDLTGDGVVMSFVMARRLGVGVGDTLTLFSDKSLRELVKLAEDASANGDGGEGDSDAGRDTDAAAVEPVGEGRSLEDRMRESVLPVDVTVVGLLDTTRETASSYLILPLAAGQDLYELGEMVPQLSVRVVDPYSVEGMLRKIEAAVGDRAWSGWTWTRKHRDALQAVQMERIMMYFVLFVIVLVAAFSVMNTMITVTVQKRQEIGMTGALGARVSQIVWVFLAQGMVVGAFGVVAGTALGALLLRFREQFRWVVHKITGFEIFDVATYGTFEIPARVVPSDVAVICCGAFLLCTLAALAPAYFAARIDPARALRNL
jgi:lipoprotein-releasing system permease protein